METRLSRTATESKKNPMMLILDQFIRFRYLIALILLVLGIMLKWNGSSIGVWDSYITQRDDGKKTDVIFGESRAIRSDEWKVQTPFYLSQAEEDYPVINEAYSLDGQNMIIAYNAPVKDITIIGKPFNWGFLFLGGERGLSWYWCFKIIAMFLLAYELAIILTKRNRSLSLFSAVWITFSPAVQWWFMQHAGDLIFFAMGLMIAFYSYFANHEQKLFRFGMLLLAIICGIGFVLVIYPAHQVMLGYLILFFVIGILVHFRRQIEWDWLDLVMIGAAVIFVGGVLWHFYDISKDALIASLSTVYPGNRISTGGDLRLSELFYFLTNWRTPFEDITFLNNCEVAFFYNLFPVVFLSAPFTLLKKNISNDQFIGRILMTFCLFALFWMKVGLPESIAKITLLSYVPTGRAQLTFGFAATLLTIWFIGYIWREKTIPIWFNCILVLVITALFAFSISRTEMAGYFPRTETIVTILGGAIIVFSLLFNLRKTFYLLFGSVIIVSGCFVNPIVVGTGAIFEKTLTKEIQKIEAANPNQLWLSEGELYNYTPTLGVRSFNTVRFYPDMSMWQQIDPEAKYEEYYNRYAHVHALISDQETSFQLDYPDSFTVTLGLKDAEKLGVKYVISTRRLDDYNLSDKTKFIKIYGPDQDNYTIFEIAYSKEAESMITDENMQSEEPIYENGSTDPLLQ